MSRGAVCKTRFYIISHRPVWRSVAILVAAWLVAGPPAQGQLLGSAVEDLLGQVVDAQVESAIEAQVELDLESGIEAAIDLQIEADVEASALDLVETGIEAAVEQQVEAGVEASVEEQLESGIEAAVEQQVEADVEASVAEQIESGIEAAVEQQVEADVEASVAETIEAGVEAAIEQQVEADVEASVAELVEAGVQATIEQQIEAGVEASLGTLIEAGVQATVEQQVEADIEASVADLIEAGVQAGIEQHIEAGVSEDINGVVEAQLDDSIGLGLENDVDPLETLPETAGGQGEAVADDTPDGDESAARFVADVDADGNTVEADTWVVLVPAQFAAQIPTWGFTVRERRALEALDRVLLRVDAPEDRDIAQAALDLALDAPGTVVDYNHVYQTAHEGAADFAALAARPPESESVRAESKVAIGMIDSWVDASHPALRSVEIQRQDFVSFDHVRPTAHGTAVASVIANAGGPEDPTASPFDTFWAASVFFNDGANMRATTTGMIAAVDWLARVPDLGVINMSLSGPPNKPLEVALETVAAEGIVLVAAVGNNGPVGDPLYPAAYDSVVGVTAVDTAHRIYRYANRGRQVMFSAPGVEVEVASPTGGFTTQSGTSLAAPYVAALIAETMAARGWSSVDALNELKATAIDLGERHYDEIFGFGLVHRTGPACCEVAPTLSALSDPIKTTP